MNTMMWREKNVLKLNASENKTAAPEPILPSTPFLKNFDRSWKTSLNIVDRAEFPFWTVFSSPQFRFDVPSPFRSDSTWIRGPYSVVGSKEVASAIDAMNNMWC